MLLRALDAIPDLLATQAAHREYFPYLLQSSGDSGFDILMGAPRESRLWWRAKDAAAVWAALQALPLKPLAAPDGGLSAAAPGDELPFRGGWFVYLGYEMLHALEPSVMPWPATGADQPLAAITRIPLAVVVNRGRQQAWLVAEDDAGVELAQAEQRLCPSGTLPQVLQLADLAEENPAAFLAGVATIRDYIRAGDVFQVNLSRAWVATLRQDSCAADVYAALRAANPGPFNALADFGSVQIISSSPERLLQVRHGRCETRPIAGTHPRSPDAAEDAALKARLLASSKERAEHIMLIDLERNDLGRVCRPGSVRVAELMTVESYAFVHHIESVVGGDLRSGVTAAQVLQALFPGGTITGCPKVRTMQIIRELESGPRGAYTGSLGYMNVDGSMDFNILIRSFAKQGRQLCFRAGAGIVADSLPERELQETRAKARGLLRALGVE